MKWNTFMMKQFICIVLNVVLKFLYLDQDEQCVYYVFHNGNIDLESDCFESDGITDEEHGAIRCNSTKCNWVK
jgi:hypothetical protein